MERAVLEVVTSRRRETSLYSVLEDVEKKLITSQGYHKVCIKSHKEKGGIKMIEGKSGGAKVDKRTVSMLPTVIFDCLQNMRTIKQSSGCHATGSSCLGGVKLLYLSWIR